jgi:hypothetical protein
MKGREGTSQVHYIILILASLIIALSPSAFAVKGPRNPGLLIKYYSSVEAAYTALKASEIDMIGYELTGVLYADAITDPNICLGRVSDQGMYELDVNNNCSIRTYPGVESFIFGKKRIEVRKALTYLADKDLIVTNCCQGFVERIDQLLAAPHKGYHNQTHPGWGESSFTYEYDPAMAVTLLDGEGFIQGSTPNPAYDPALSWSSRFLRVYPNDHPTHAGQDVHPIVMAIRTDDLKRFCAGDLLKYHIETIGFTVAAIYGSSTQLYDQVMGDMDYHIYTGGWSLGRFPPLYQYGLLHSSQWYPYGSNYITGVDADGNPNYPDLDESLIEGYTALSYTTAKAAVKKSSGLAHHKYCIHIPLWSTASYWAWRCNVKGVVHAEGAGPENGYSFMNMYKTDDTAFVYGTIRWPTCMNVIYSDWYYDYQNLDRIELYGNGIRSPPYDLSVDQGNFATTWETGTYIDYDTGENCSKNTFHYRSDTWSVEPITGNPVENYNATHVYQSIWYYYQTPDAWDFSGVQYIDHLNIPDNDSTLEMYWDRLSYWNTYYGGTAILSFDLLRNDPLSVFHTEDIAWSGGSGMDWVGLANPGVFWIERTVTLDGVPLVQGIDYEIYNPSDGYGGDGDMRLIKSTPAGNLHVEYWVKNDGRGYYPGDLPWQTCLQGAGMYYAVDFQPGPGGYLALRRNPYYYMETPPLGEIDFVRKASGCFKIDIFDVVIVASSYGSQGSGIHDDNWFPGADLIPECCRVDIFDVVTMTAKYGLEWDIPPP